VKSTVRSLAEIGGTWALIAGALLMASQTSSVPLRALLFLVIASRQYALIVLNHEAFHSLLSPRPKLNDWMGRFLLSFPLGSAFDVSRKKHLSHHRLLGRTEDPDYVWYEIGERHGLIGLVQHLLDLPRRQLTYTYAAKPNEKASKRLGWVIGYQVGWIAGLTALGGIWVYPLFWVAPLFLAVLLDKLRSFCEHTSSLPASSVPVVRTFLSNPVERFFLSPFDMNYHAEHHRFPHVPHYRLREYSAKLLELEGGTHYRAETSYLAALWRQTRTKEVPA